MAKVALLCGLSAGAVAAVSPAAALVLVGGAVLLGIVAFVKSVNEPARM